MGYHATLNAQPSSRGVRPRAATAPLVEPVETLARRGPPAARRVVPVAEKG
ncbi:hypothetical protein [Nocardioides pakistanensis]